MGAEAHRAARHKVQRAGAGRRLSPQWPAAAFLLALAVVAAAGVVSVLSGLEQPQDLEARARAIARELTCPVCQGQSVAESNSVVARQMRAEIGQMLEQGRTREEILSHYVDLYGTWILGRPPARGPYVLLWGMPLAALAAGAAAFLGRRPPAAGDHQPPRGEGDG